MRYQVVSWPERRSAINCKIPILNPVQDSQLGEGDPSDPL